MATLRPRTINVYIFKEMVVPFFLSLGIMTATVLMAKALKLIELLINSDIGPVFAITFLFSITPSFLIYTIPASFLIAVLIACTRLSSDSEIIAMKSTGLGLMSFMKPVFICAGFACLLTLLITLYLLPLGNYTKKSLLFEAARSKTSSGIEERTFYFQKDLALFVDKMGEGGVMEGVFLMNVLKGREVNTITAERGVFVPSTEKMSISLRLYNGEIHNEDEDTGDYHLASFSTYTLTLDAGGGTLKGRIEGTERELFVGEIIDRISKNKSSGTPTTSLTMDLHRRFALPASVFVFAILAVPLGIQKVRSARLTGFTASVGVFSVYYMTMKFFKAFGESGALHPIAAAWGANVLLGLVGAVVLYRAAMDKPPVIWPAAENFIHNMLVRSGLGTHKQDKGRGGE